MHSNRTDIRDGDGEEKIRNILAMGVMQLSDDSQILLTRYYHENRQLFDELANIDVFEGDSVSFAIMVMTAKAIRQLARGRPDRAFRIMVRLGNYIRVV